MPYIKKADWNSLQLKLKTLKAIADDRKEDSRLSELKEHIKSDIRKVHIRDISQLMINTCIQHDIRYEANVPETGKKYRVQPYELTDFVYNVVSKDTLTRILKETDVDRAAYKPDDHDCEDFARELVSVCHKLGINSVGRVFSDTSRHAFNIAIVKDDKEISVEFIEPQNDAFVKPNTNGYELADALIIIS